MSMTARSHVCFNKHCYIPVGKCNIELTGMYGRQTQSPFEPYFFFEKGCENDQS